MILETISSPADLRELSYEQLDVLTEEMRQLIVESVTANGGHLGSNLGVVELTLAVHRVFDSPRDIILWDTGHQTYPHKIVTGRANDFEHLRQAGGMSGYPSRDESEHDWIENSHASTVLSYAYGLATAEASSQGSNRRVVASSPRIRDRSILESGVCSGARWPACRCGTSRRDLAPRKRTRRPVRRGRLPAGWW